MHQLKINRKITRRDETSVNIYLQEVSRYSMVTPEEEAELALKIRNGDETAMHKLVEANLRFVISVAKQFQNHGMSFVDLINEGNIGLVKAAGKFDETRGFKFISYAVWWIRQSIMTAIADQTRAVRLPINRIASINKIKKAIPYLEQQYEREPTNSELADYLEVNVEQIESNNRMNQLQISFDKPIGEGENDFTLYDLIQTENSTTDNKLIMESTKINLTRAMKKLSARESKILTLLYGLNNQKAHTLNEIAILINVTNERVRQIKGSALFKLKKILSGKTLFHNDI